jgi:hypothetical protein
MTSRMRSAKVVGAAWLLAACASPYGNSLDGGGTASGSGMSLAGKHKAASSDDTDPACAPSGNGIEPRDVACADPSSPLSPAPSPAAPAAPPTPAPIKASLAVTRHPDDASSTNCLKVQVNGGPLIDLGCNKGALVSDVQIDAMPTPACNVVRLLLFTNGTLNRTTESAENIALDFRIRQTGFNAFAIQCNDNRDNDFNDLNLDIASADASITIENTGLGCVP